MERAAAGQLSMKIDLVITVQYVPYPLWFEPNIRFTFADILAGSLLCSAFVTLHFWNIDNHMYMYMYVHLYVVQVAVI